MEWIIFNYVRRVVLHPFGNLTGEPVTAIWVPCEVRTPLMAMCLNLESLDREIVQIKI